MRTDRITTLRVFNPKMLPILILLFPFFAKLSNFPLDRESNTHLGAQSGRFGVAVVKGLLYNAFTKL